MKVIQCQESYSKINLRISITSFVLVLAVLLPTLPLIFIFVLPQLSRWISQLILIFGGWLILCVEIFVLWLLWKLNSRLYSKDIRETIGYWRGHDGELRVEEFLNRYSDSESIVFAHINIPEIGNEDIDFLIAGPKGLTILEVKNWNGKFWVIWDRIFKHLKSGLFWLPSKNPFDQAERQYVGLTRFVENNKIPIPIRKFIVFLGGRIENIVGRPPVYVIRDEVDFTKQIDEMPRIIDDKQAVLAIQKIIAANARPNCIASISNHT